MGCMCSHELHNVDAAPIDIRARYSIDYLRHHPDHLNDAYSGHGRPQPAHLTVYPAPAGTGPLPHSSSGSLSRSQWKQMRALARSTTNPHFHQMQQLQLVQSRALDRQQQPDQLHSALAAAAVGHPASQHQHHHQHNHQHHVHLPVVHGGLNPSSQGLVSSTTGHTAGSAPGLASKPPAHDALKPTEVLALCGAVVEEEPALAAAGIQPLLLAALCLIESAGRQHAKQYRDHVGDVALGLGQMLLSTAQWLASSKGFDRYGTNPSASDLEDAKVCIYYCAAYLSILAQHDGLRRSEGFIVKAYHAGPKGVHSQAAGLYWQKYLKAKHCLGDVVQAMTVTLAAAAAAAGLPLSLPAGEGTPAVAAAAAAAAGVVAGHAAASLGGSTDSEQQRQKGWGGSSTPAARDDSSSSPSTGGKDASRTSSGSAQDVWVWAKAAQLICSLASRWERDGALTGSAHAGTGSFMSSILPVGSLWHHSEPVRAQQQQQEAQSQTQQQTQQQQQQQHDAGSGGALLRRWRSGGAAAATASSKSHTHTNSSTGTGGALGLVPVARAAFDAALLRLCCIDHSATCTALSNAACSAAVAAAASGAHSRGHTSYRGSSSGAAGVVAVVSGAAAAAAGPTDAAKAGRHARSSSSASSSSTDAHADMPCVMHVVGHGETLTQIAAICGVAVPDILAANPDLLAGTNLQANDCIALPVPVIPPRLHVIQMGDTIHSIAKAHRVPLGRLIAKNPELTDPARVQPGWVVALPGLKGDSKSGMSLDWLAAAAAAAVAAPQAEEPAWEGVGKDGEVEQAGITNASVLSWQQQDLERQQHQRFGGDRGSGLGQGFKTAGLKVPDDQHAGWSSDITAAAPALGSGVFMFAVGQGSSSSGMWSSQAAMQHRGKHSSSVSSSGARDTRKDWAVGAAAHELQAVPVAAAAAHRG